MGRYDPRRPVAVSPFNGSTILYGFNTSIDANDSQVLGHQDALDPNLTGLVFGANSPKPARARRTRATGTVSSYIDWTAVAAARAQSWSVGLGSVRRGGSTAKTQVVFVTHRGIRYAWPLPNEVIGQIGAELEGLGIRLSDTNDTDLVFGARPKPPQATKLVGSGDSANRITTFYDESVGTLPEGWSSVSSGHVVTQAP